MERPDHHHEALRNAGFEITKQTPFDSAHEKLSDDDSDIYGNISQPLEDDDRGEGCGPGMC